MHIQGNSSAVDRNSVDPTATTVTAPTRRTIARITVSVQNFIDSLFRQNVVPAPARPVQASSPQWQAKPAISSLASEQLRPALMQDNWGALECARSHHPGLPDNDRSLMLHAVHANASHIAIELQRRGVDAFGPDAEGSAFFAALRTGKDHLAEQMLAESGLETPGEFPDLAPHLECALDKNDRATIDWLINWSSRHNVQLPCDVLQNAVKNKNFARVHLLTNDASLAHDLKLRPGTNNKRLSVPWLSTVSQNSGQAALHQAVASGDPALVNILLDCGADVDRTNSAGLTPLALALDKGLFDLATHLLERGARPIITTSASLAEEKLGGLKYEVQHPIL